MGPVVMTQTAFDSLVPRASDSLVLAKMAGGDQAGVDSLTAALGAYPDGSAQTSAAFVEERAKDIDTLLNLLYVLLALSVVVSMFGMVNTLALAVIERTRELGLLRAVGMSRRQVRRMIRSESVTTALIGAVMGLPIGIGLAALVTRALGDYDVGFSLPVTGLLDPDVVGHQRRDPGGGRPRPSRRPPRRAAGTAVRVVQSTHDRRTRRAPPTGARRASASDHRRFGRRARDRPGTFAGCGS